MTTTKTGRCTGHCCRAIGLPISPRDLVIARDYLSESWVFDGDQAERLDALNVTSMLIPMGIKSMTDPLTGVKGTLRHWYTCVHHDVKTGDCTNYEDRPRLCRSYPYQPEARCPNPECTMRGRGGRGKTTRLAYPIAPVVRRWHRKLNVVA